MPLLGSPCAAVPPELARLFAEGWSRLPGEPLDVRIHARDEMLTFALEQQKRPFVEALHEYFLLGAKARDLVADVLAWRGRTWGDVRTMLDFASGYGRVTRFLVQHVPPSALHVADVLTDAVDFQRATFGVHGFASAFDPDAVRLPPSPDLITVVSLFTHLPEAAFRDWLRKLANGLAPDGLLVLTTQGPWCHEHDFGKPMAGEFVFREQSESKRLDRKRYGVTYCAEARFRQLLAAAGDFRVSAFVPRGLNDHQDVWVVERAGASPAREPLRLRSMPRVELDVARRWGSGVECAGWALQADGRPAAAVELRLGGGAVLDGLTTGVARPDLVSAFGTPASLHGGFTLHGSAPPRGEPKWILARAVDDAGRAIVRIAPFPKPPT